MFGQRIIYRKKIEKFICEPNFEHDPKINDIIQWIWKTRLPFFFRSHIYAEYKVRTNSKFKNLNKLSKNLQALHSFFDKIIDPKCQFGITVAS